MVVPLKMFFGLLAAQGGGSPPGPSPYHIQTLCYEGDGTTYRRLDIPGVDLSYSSGSGMLILRCISDAGPTYAFFPQTRTEAYPLSRTGQHEQNGPHGVYELGNEYVTLGTSPHYWNAAGSTYSLIAIQGTNGSGQKYFDGALNNPGDPLPHALGRVPTALWICENRSADKQSYHQKYGLTPEDYTIMLNRASAIFSTGYWRNTQPDASSYRCTTGYGHAYFAWGDVTGTSLMHAYEGAGGPMQVDLGFRPKFVIIKEYESADNWYWFTEAMEDCDWYHYGIEQPAPAGDLVDFTSNGIYLKDSNLTKNVWYEVIAVG